jgi:hypothetical protein
MEIQLYPATWMPGCCAAAMHGAVAVLHSLCHQDLAPEAKDAEAFHNIPSSYSSSLNISYYILGYGTSKRIKYRVECDFNQSIFWHMLIYDDIRTYPSTLHHYMIWKCTIRCSTLCGSQRTCGGKLVKKTSQNLGVFSLALTPDTKRKVRFSWRRGGQSKWIFHTSKHIMMLIRHLIEQQIDTRKSCGWVI